MGVWKINSATAESLGIENIVFTFRNQDVDEVLLQFHANVDVVFWPYEYALTISLDGVTKFRGIVTGRRKRATGQQEAIDLTVSGPWHHFNRTIYGRNNYYTNGAQFSGRAFIGGALSTQVSTIVSYMAGLGKCQVGTIDLPSLNVPGSEVRDLTCSQVMRDMLRWIPGAEVSFDYSVNPPLCNVLKPDSGSIQTYSKTVGTDKISGVNVFPRDDLKVANVVLIYERQFELRNTVYDPTKGYVPFEVNNQLWQPIGAGYIQDPDTQSENLYERVGIDQSGGGVVPGTLMKTLLLAGMKRWQQFYFRQNNWSTGYNSLAWHRADINNLRYLFEPWQGWMATVGQFAASDIGWVENAESVVTSPINTSRLFPIPEIYAPPRELWRSAEFNDGFEVWRVAHSAKWYQVSGSGTSYLNDSRRFFNAYSFNGVLRDWTWINRAIEESDPVLESMPTGLAADMYARLQADNYDLTVDLVDEEVEFLGPLVRKMSLVGHGIGLVQKVTHNAFSGRTTITVGTPSHLGPQDLLELVRLRPHA